MQNIKIIILSILGIFLIQCFESVTAQNIVVKNKSLVIEFNNNLESRVKASFASKQLMQNFSASEYIVSKYGDIKTFELVSQHHKNFYDSIGKGTLFVIKGINKKYKIEKLLTIKTYDAYEDAAFYNVAYINKNNINYSIIKWVNNNYNIIPSNDTTKFWSFQGSSSGARADWILKVNHGFYQKNYLGMNDADYGGGIPVTDIWRPDAGIAIGHVETVPRLVSLPVDYDQNKGTANISIEYEYPGDRHTFKPNDTLFTYQTFVSIHQKDCFSTLRQFAQFMDAKGIKPAPSEEAAFEPIWCAWGYERDFTLQQIINTLPKVKELGIKWVGLDDGYQQAEGDWHTNKAHFPNGDTDMKKFVNEIHEEGMKAVLWWAPLAVSPGSKLLKSDPNILLIQKNGAPQFITWWNAYYMSPTYTGTLNHTKKMVNLFLNDWGFDALKMDGQHQNAVAPDYAENHNISYPAEACEKLPEFYEMIYKVSRKIKPNAVLEICPCGDCMSFYNMPYTNQFVASDPESSWQVRLKGKVYKALMPGTAYFGDHVELTDDKEDFASQLGVGAVLGTKFVWPATGVKSKDENYLTPEKEKLFKKWFSLYNEKMLSRADYRGDLYDIGYDYPETYAIEKKDTMFYAFYNPQFKGMVNLRGLDVNKNYKIRDYFNNKDLGNVSGNNSKIKVLFKKFLLIEAIPESKKQ